VLDPARLRLVMRNLIGNALRHGQADGQPARLQLTLEPGAADLPPVMTPGRHGSPEADPPAAAAGGPTRAAVATADAGVWLSVRDFGPGVPPDQLVRLGAAFWRADPARQRSTGGVGLGLTLVRLVVQAHGGRLVFTAAAPGLRVSLWLPRRPAPAGLQPAPRHGPA
jgi:signal transduction histidine kinase